MSDAHALTLSLGGKWRGAYGSAPCPICQPERRHDQDALTLKNAPNGRLLVHCKKFGCDFRDLAAALGLTSGTFTAPDPAATAKREVARQIEAARKSRQARSVWTEAQPISGTLAEAYLRGRGITCALPANQLATRAHALGWQVSLLPAPDGRDWNDVLQGKVTA